MQLGAYLINGAPVSELSAWNADELEGNPPFVTFEGVPPSGYEDVSSIENWFLFKVLTGRDFLFIRREINDLITAAGGWGMISSDEKRVAALMHLGSVAERNAVLGESDHREEIQNYRQLGETTRRARVNAMIENLRLRLLEADFTTTTDELAADDLIEEYIFAEKENPLLDYLQGAGAYAGAGLANSGFVPVGITLGDLVLESVDLIENGSIGFGHEF